MRGRAFSSSLRCLTCFRSNSRTSRSLITPSCSRRTFIAAPRGGLPCSSQSQCQFFTLEFLFKKCFKSFSSGVLLRYHSPAPDDASMASEAFAWVDQNVGRVMGKETLSANGLFLETLFTVDGSRMSNKHSYRLTKSAGSSQSWLRKLKNGIPEDLELVVKTSRPESHLGEDEVFRGEALSLQAISFSDSFRTPHVLAFSDGWDGGFMVSEYVELVDTDKLNPATSELSREDILSLSLGQRLGELHSSKPLAPEARQGKFGFPVATALNGIAQPNHWDADWVRFFREQRIGHQLSIMDTKDPTTAKLRSAWERALKSTHQLAALFDKVEIKPVILHGDLSREKISWGKSYRNNRYWPVVIAPSSYYGHHEAEFGLSACSDWNAEFWRGYRQLVPEGGGSASARMGRAALYELYHRLNQYNSYESIGEVDAKSNASIRAMQLLGFIAEGGGQGGGDGQGGDGQGGGGQGRGDGGVRGADTSATKGRALRAASIIPYREGGLLSYIDGTCGVDGRGMTGHEAAAMREKWVAWFSAWRGRMEHWWAALPIQAAARMQNCAAFLGGALTVRFHRFLALNFKAKGPHAASGSNLPPPAATSSREEACESTLSRVALPDFPEAPDVDGHLQWRPDLTPWPLWPRWPKLSPEHMIVGDGGLRWEALGARDWAGGAGHAANLAAQSDVTSAPLLSLPMLGYGVALGAAIVITGVMLSKFLAGYYSHKGRVAITKLPEVRLVGGTVPAR